MCLRGGLMLRVTSDCGQIKSRQRLVTHAAAESPFCFPTRPCKMHDCIRGSMQIQVSPARAQSCTHTWKMHVIITRSDVVAEAVEWTDTHRQTDLCSWKYTPSDLLSTLSVCVWMSAWRRKAEERMKCYSKAQQDFPIKSSRKTKRLTET